MILTRVKNSFLMVFIILNCKIPCSGEPRDAITQAFNLAEKPGKTGSVNLDYSDCTNGLGYIEQSYPKVRDEVL